jgi:formylglycine-generating enzyme required for sulfatase activity/beta-lactamase regulating signal transducer with metallopeptidase domain
MDFASSMILRTSAVLLLAALLCLALRRASAALRHDIWAIALISALLMPLAGLLLPSINIPFLQPSPAITPKTASVPQPAVSYISPTVPLPALADNSSASRPISPAIDHNWSWKSFLFVTWMFVAIAIFTRFPISYLAYLKLMRHASDPEDDRLRNAMSLLKAKLSISLPVRIRIRDGEFPPMTFGFRRYVILLPGQAENWTDERQWLVLAHELAHVRRRDGLLQIVDHLACALNWFNPLVWLASNRLYLERERACDDEVLSLGINADTYAAHLLAIARTLKLNSGLATAAIPIAQTSHLETRLVSIINRNVQRRSLSFCSRILILACGVLMVASFTSLRLTAIPLPVMRQPAFAVPTMIAPFVEATESVGALISPTESHGTVLPPFQAEFVAIAPGTFTMGCQTGEGCFEPELPAHPVRITKNFEIGRYEVTQEQWQAVTESNPSEFRGTHLPVEQVSWNDIQGFLNALNARHDGFQYRLPTEAEWEYAARAGGRVNWVSGPRIPAFNGLDALADVAWTGRNSDGHTHPVGEKQPNAWGLYDMFGNVAELTSDWFQESDDATTAVDPQGPATGFGHVVRGSSWDLPFSPRLRFDAGNDAKYDFIGFRLVRERTSALTGEALKARG